MNAAGKKIALNKESLKRFLNEKNKKLSKVIHCLMGESESFLSGRYVGIIIIIIKKKSFLSMAINILHGSRNETIL